MKQVLFRMKDDTFACLNVSASLTRTLQDTCAFMDGHLEVQSVELNVTSLTQVHSEDPDVLVDTELDFMGFAVVEESFGVAAPLTVLTVNRGVNGALIASVWVHDRAGLATESTQYFHPLNLC